MENSYLKAEIAVGSADVVYFSRRPKFHHMMQFFYITLKVPYYPSYMKVCSDFLYSIQVIIRDKWLKEKTA